LEIPSKKIYLFVNKHEHELTCQNKGEKTEAIQLFFFGVKLPLLSGILEAFPNSNLTFGLSSPNF